MRDSRTILIGPTYIDDKNLHQLTARNVILSTKDVINGFWIIKVGLKCPYNDDYESAVWCGGAIHTGIAHGALRIYGVNGPQAPHTWEPAGSKPSSPIGREQANPALWLVQTRLCHSHHPRVHSAHTPQGTLLDCKTSLTFRRIPEKPNRVASCINN